MRLRSKRSKIVISAQYLHSIIQLSKPTTIEVDMVFGETDFGLIDGEFIEWCLKHNNNADTVFKKSRSVVSGGELITGIVRWLPNDTFGHVIVVKYKGEYYQNIEPIWPDSVNHKSPEFEIGDRVECYGNGSGTILSYRSAGSYSVQMDNGKLEIVHIRGMK